MSNESNSGLLTVKPGEVAVRMYRQGLGDCFLLAFGGKKEDDATRYVLIDCGVHKRQDDGRERMSRVLENLLAATGGRLDVVVATHEHADHLSGFVQKESPFLQQEFEIGQLWLAWTEQFGDDLADKLRERRGTARKIIQRAVEEATHAAFAGPQELRLGLDSFVRELEANADFEDESSDTDYDEALRLINSASRDRQSTRGLKGRFTDQQGVAPRGLGAARKKERDRPSTNELAMGVLQAQADQIEFCTPGKVLKIEGVSGVRVHVLGPPHNELMLKKDSPTPNRDARDEGRYQETYLSSASQSLSFGLSPALQLNLNDTARPPDDLRFPFDATQRRKLVFSFPEDQQFDDLPVATREMLDNRYLHADSAWRRIDADWLGTSAELALNLDSDTNNTSLVLAFEWNDRVLLFVGDAQVGNWLSWRDQKYKDPRGRETLTINDLLDRTLLYKVGHHGSHNATLKRDPQAASATFPLGAPYGLELMHDIVALIPVDRAAAEKDMPHSWEMPHEALYERLREKARRRVLRSDAAPNIRPLSDESLPDVTPQSTRPKPVPDMPNATWRKSAESFPSTEDPLFYEIVLSRQSR